MAVVFTSPTVQTIAEAISSQLAEVNIRTLPVLSDGFTPPIALVGCDEVRFHERFGGISHYTFTVFVVVARSDAKAGIQLLEQYMSNAGDLSIRQALEADPTLDSVVDSCTVVKAGPPAAITIVASGVSYIAVPFDVEIVA